MVVGTLLARGSPGWWGPDGWRWVWAIQGVIALVVALGARSPCCASPAAPGPLAPPRLTALRHVPGWLPYTAGYFLFGFGYMVTMTYTVASLRDAGFNPAHAADVYALVGIGVVVGGLLMGRLSDRLGRRRTIILGYSLTAACPLLLLTGREPFVAVASIGFGARVLRLGRGRSRPTWRTWPGPASSRPRSPPPPSRSASARPSVPRSVASWSTGRAASPPRSCSRSPPSPRPPPWRRPCRANPASPTAPAVPATCAPSRGRPRRGANGRSRWCGRAGRSTPCSSPGRR